MPDVLDVLWNGMSLSRPNPLKLHTMQSAVGAPQFRMLSRTSTVLSAAVRAVRVEQDCLFIVSIALSTLGPIPMGGKSSFHRHRPRPFQPEMVWIGDDGNQPSGRVRQRSPEGRRQQPPPGVGGLLAAVKGPTTCCCFVARRLVAGKQLLA